MKPKKADRPDKAASREAKMVWALDDFDHIERPAMVTSWISIVEYMDHLGETHLVSLCSELSQWRLAGMLEIGREMLFAEYEYDEESSDYDD